MFIKNQSWEDIMLTKIYYIFLFILLISTSATSTHIIALFQLINNNQEKNAIIPQLLDLIAQDNEVDPNLLSLKDRDNKNKIAPIAINDFFKKDTVQQTIIVGSNLTAFIHYLNTQNGNNIIDFIKKYEDPKIKYAAIKIILIIYFQDGPMIILLRQGSLITLDTLMKTLKVKIRYQNQKNFQKILKFNNPEQKIEQYQWYLRYLGISPL